MFSAHRVWSAYLVLAVSVCANGLSQAATLPSHAALKILVVSDEVNPNNLTDAELTQPGDISAALNADDSGIALSDAGALEVNSQCADDALASLESDTPPDVVIYFAHRAALGCDGSDVQERFTADIEAHLVRGGGFVVFHHGIYAWAGKDSIIDLIGGQANSINYDTKTGQRIFAVAPGHFVTTNGLTYTNSGHLDAVAGVAAGDYPYFDNVPDERYPDTTLTLEDGETREILFASDSGGLRVISYSLQRPGWKGRVVTYQSGEYQPHALDDREGPNFQILANAILYSTGTIDAAGKPIGDCPGSSSPNATTDAGVPDLAEPPTSEAGAGGAPSLMTPASASATATAATQGPAACTPPPVSGMDPQPAEPLASSAPNDSSPSVSSTVHDTPMTAQPSGPAAASSPSADTANGPASAPGSASNASPSAMSSSEASDDSGCQLSRRTSLAEHGFGAATTVSVPLLGLLWFRRRKSVATVTSGRA